MARPIYFRLFPFVPLLFFLKFFDVFFKMRKSRLKKHLTFLPFFLEIHWFHFFNGKSFNKFARLQKYRLYSRAKRFALGASQHGKTQNRIFENPIFSNPWKFLTFFGKLRCKLPKTDPQFFGSIALWARGIFSLNFFRSCPRRKHKNHWQLPTPHPDGIIRTLNFAPDFGKFSVVSGWFRRGAGKVPDSP